MTHCKKSNHLICLFWTEIDQRVANEIVKKIKHTYKEALCENDNREIDEIPDVLTNDTIGNNKYINEHRNWRKMRSVS